MKLIDTLHIDSIKLPLSGSHKKAVIGELIDLLAMNRRISSKDSVMKAVLAREQIMTTGVGNGVAIPHCKSDMLSEFAIALGIHPGGIDFHALDEAPARIVFLLVGPSSQPRGHILLLSRISRIVSKAPVRDALLKSSSPQEIWALLEANETESLQVKS